MESSSLKNTILWIFSDDEILITLSPDVLNIASYFGQLNRLNFIMLICSYNSHHLVFTYKQKIQILLNKFGHELDLNQFILRFLVVLEQ